MMRLASRISAAAVAVFVVGIATPAFAEGINIDHVQSDEGTVSVVVGVDALPAGTEIDDGAWQVAIGGDLVEVATETVSSGDIERTTILALDASQSMQGEPFEAAKAAARAFLEAAPQDIQIGLVTFAGDVTNVADPTDDRAGLIAALDEIELALDTHLYDGIVEAVNLTGDEGSRSVLVLSDGKDRGSSASLDEVSLAATDAGVVVDVVALNQKQAARALLAEISGASGGQVLDASTPDALTQVFEAQAEALASQVLLQFDQPEGVEGDTTIDVTLTVDGQTFAVSALANLVPDATAGLNPVKSPGSSLGSGVLLGGAVALGLGLAAILAVLFLGDRSGSRAERQIDTYLGAGDPNAATSHRAAMPTQTSLRDSAVALSEKVVKGDLESRLNTRLVGGGLSLTAAEWLLLHAGIVVAAGFVGLILGGGILLGIGVLLGVFFPWFYLRWKHSRRLRAFNSQLAETLTLIAGGLSAGLSMPQAVDTVVREGHEPMAGELRRALIEQRLGVDITDALDGVAVRMESEDFSWVVMAIRIQREVGGNLAEILNTVADTLREREYLRRQVQVLSAEGRMSGYVLGALPIGMFLYMFAVRGEYVRPLYTTVPGIFMSIAACLLWVLGFFAMSRLVKIEV